MSGRPWTPDEVAFVQRHHKRQDAIWIGRQIGRTQGAVLQQLHKLGLYALRPRLWWRGEFLEFVREHAAAGLLDPEIVVKWNARRGVTKVYRRLVSHIRKVAGIGTTAPQRANLAALKRENQRKQMEQLGIQRPIDLCIRKWRRQAIAAGWPIDCRPSEVRLLNALADGQARTRLEIVQAMGQTPTYSACRGILQNFDNGRGNSVLGELIRRGLIVRSAHKERRGDGKGRSCYTYRLTLKAIEFHRRATRRKCG